MVLEEFCEFDEIRREVALCELATGRTSEVTSGCLKTASCNSPNWNKFQIDVLKV